MSPAVENLTHARLQALLSYDATDGQFRYVGTRGPKGAGSSAGTTTTHGYIAIKIDGFMHKAHRLAWFYVNGHWPENDIDHINGIKSDNRIANLRDVTRRVNVENKRKARADNQLSMLGVSPRRNRFRAAIHVCGHHKHLGYFDTKEEAQAAYLNAKRSLHEGVTI